MSGRAVAVLGASTDRAKYGNKAVRAHVRQGWDVYPVNPNAQKIEGLTCYSSLEAVPAAVDRVTLYLPPKLGIAALPAIAAAKPKEFFVNPGAESEELIEQARALGLDPIMACSILDIGETPQEIGD